jgi:hypothetical protein
MTQPAAAQYRTAEGGWVKDAPFWTVAYRTPRANRFLRVALALTWQQAYDLSAKLVAARPDLQVHYVTNGTSWSTPDAGSGSAKAAPFLRPPPRGWPSGATPTGSPNWRPLASSSRRPPARAPPGACSSGRRPGSATTSAQTS